MEAYKTITHDGILEIEIKKSRFICQLKRVETEEEARNFIQSVKKEHYRANHNCSAFILGEASHIKRSSDDGEPSGTAGIPMLTVLENKELTNVVAVVTRYFGGIKLGAGGLIRAYTESVATACQEIGTVVVKEQEGLLVTLSYAQYQEFANWRALHQLEEYDTRFETEVQATLYADKERIPSITEALTDYYRGRIKLETGESRIIEVPSH